MLDFGPVRSKQMSVAELAADLEPADLIRLTDEMVDAMLAVLDGCTDADVTCVPDDPEAFDAAAASEAEVHMPWTLGHVVVHTTASSEEAAAMAAEMARGVPDRGGRSRYEVPWQSVTTLAQCRRRLEESRRMRLASLTMWPDQPYLDNYFTSRSGRRYNAVARFLLGLMHDDSHLPHMAKIVKQIRRPPPPLSEPVP